MDDCGVFRTDEALRRLTPVVARPAATATQRRASRTRARSSTRTSSRHARSGYLLDCAEATVAAAPRPHRESRRPLPRGLSRSATTATGSSTRWPSRPRAGRGSRPQTGDHHALRTQAADLLSRSATRRCRSSCASCATTPTRRQAALGVATPSRPARWTACSTCCIAVKWEHGRHADLPPFVRPRRVRLGRDAHQRPQPAGLQDPRRPAGHRKISVAPLPGLPVVKDLVVDMDGLLQQVPERQAVPHQREPGAGRASASRRPPSGARYDDTTKCILCAACTSSCPSFWAQKRTSARPPSSTPTASSSTRATRRPTSGWRSWPTRTASGAAGRSSTAPTPARAASTSRKPSLRSRAPSPQAALRMASPGTPAWARLTPFGQGRDGLVIPHRWRPRNNPGLGPRGPSSSTPTARIPTTRTRLPVAVVGSGTRVRTNNVAEYAGLVLASREARRSCREHRPAARLEAHRRAAQRSLAGQGRQAAGPLRRGATAPGELARWSATHEPRARNRPPMPSPTWRLDDPDAAALLVAEVARRNGREPPPVSEETSSDPPAGHSGWVDRGGRLFQPARCRSL